MFTHKITLTSTDIFSQHDVSECDNDSMLWFAYSDTRLYVPLHKNVDIKRTPNQQRNDIRGILVEYISVTSKFQQSFPWESKILLENWSDISAADSPILHITRFAAVMTLTVYVFFSRDVSAGLNPLYRNVSIAVFIRLASVKCQVPLTKSTTNQ